MNDTSVTFEEMMRIRIMQKSPEERLRMGCDMCDTAKSLVRASLPGLSGVSLNMAIFERFYGHDFDEATKKKIKAHLIRTSYRKAMLPEYSDDAV